MRLLAVVLFCPFALVLPGCGSSKSSNNDDGDGKVASVKERIVGTWESVKGEPTGAIVTLDNPKGNIDLTIMAKGSTLELTKDGRCRRKFNLGGGTLEAAGPYEIDGDTIKMAVQNGDKEDMTILKIKTLTEKVLVTENEQGKTTEFKKR